MTTATTDPLPRRILSDLVSLTAHRDAEGLRALLDSGWTLPPLTVPHGRADVLRLIDARWTEGLDLLLAARPALLGEAVVWQRIAAWPAHGLLETLFRHVVRPPGDEALRDLRGQAMAGVGALDLMQWLIVRAWGGCRHSDLALHTAVGRIDVFRDAFAWFRARGAIWRGVDGPDASGGEGYSWWSLLLLDGRWADADDLWPAVADPHDAAVGRMLLLHAATDTEAAARWWRWVAEERFGSATAVGWGSRLTDLALADGAPPAAWRAMARDAACVRTVAGWIGTDAAAAWLRQGMRLEAAALDACWRQADAQGVRPCDIAWATRLQIGAPPADWDPLQASAA